MKRLDVDPSQVGTEVQVQVPAPAPVLVLVLVLGKIVSRYSYRVEDHDRRVIRM